MLSLWYWNFKRMFLLTGTAHIPLFLSLLKLSKPFSCPRTVAFGTSSLRNAFPLALSVMAHFHPLSFSSNVTSLWELNLTNLFKVNLCPQSPITVFESSPLSSPLACKVHKGRETLSSLLITVYTTLSKVSASINVNEWMN